MNRYDSGYYNDSYYQPDDDFDDYDYEKSKYITRSIKEYMTEGCECYPFGHQNFTLAMVRMGYEAKDIEDATEIDKAIAIEYWFEFAKQLSEKDWERF